MDWLTYAISSLIIILLIYYKALSTANYWNNYGIPHLKSLPLLGNMLDVILLKKTFGENVFHMYNKLNEYKYGGYMQFTKPVLMIRDPELINQIMINAFAHFPDRGLPNTEDIEPLSANLVNLTGKRWRKIRQKLTPTFTSGKLKIMFNQIVKCTDNALDFLEKTEEVIEVKQYMQKFNLNVIGLVGFGLDVDAFNHKNEESNEFVKQSIKLFAPSIKLLINFLIRMSCPQLGKVLKLRTMDPEVTNFFTNLVKDTIQYREKTNTKINDFIQLMLNLKHQETKNQLNAVNSSTEKKYPFNEDFNYSFQGKTPLPVFTDMCITAQSFFFISGGSETTATVLSFALYELAINEDVQTRIQEEIGLMVLSKGFVYQTIKEMSYLDQVIYEVLRLHPPGGVLSRVCTEDFLLPGTNKLIKKGVLINIPVLALHMNPQYFQDPEIFNPDRFETMKSFPKGVFLPFGAGPRVCIAKRLAMLEMKIYLAKLVSKYSFSLSDKTKLPLKMAINTIIPNVEGGIWVRFVKRQM